MSSRKPMVVGNWKMNGDAAFGASLSAALRVGLPEAVLSGVDVAVCPSFPYLALVRDALSGSGIAFGAQDVASQDDGAYTGEVSTRMLADLGCALAIVGHSERRTLFGESDALVCEKAARLIAGGLCPIVCVGETLDEREGGRTESVLARQVGALAPLSGGRAGPLVLAYEPVWAIGTGLTATPEQAQASHRFIRDRLAAEGFAAADQVRLLYGGSVKPGNAASLFAMPDIDGGLIGGAALVAADFVAICRSAAAC